MELDRHLDGDRWRDRLCAMVVSVAGTEFVVVPTRVPDLTELGTSSETVRWFLDQLAVSAPTAALVDATVDVLDRHGVPRCDGASAEAFRGVHAVVDAAGIELRRPTPCPHLAAPLGHCTEERVGPDPVPTHARPHVATCGCSCSGLVRWARQAHQPLPAASLGVAARTFGGLFDAATADPWSCWDRFCERSGRDPLWLALWSELMAGGEWTDTDADRVDALCDAAFTRVDGL